MNTGLRGKISRYAVRLAIGILVSQIVLFSFVDLTDLHWPPTAWPWVIRERLTFWFSNPEELEHELREFTSLVVIGLVSIPVIFLSVWRFSRRLFAPVEAVAAKASEICAGGRVSRLPVDPDAAGDEIAVMARACNLAFERYEETFHRLERFTRDASHQLRTPLAAIRASGEVCLSRPRTAAEYQDTIGRMLESSGQLLSVVETLLNVARRDERQTREGFQPCDPAALARDIHGRFAEWAEVRGIAFTCAAGDVPRVSGDKDLLEQALSNLVDNALRLTGEGGLVEIRVSARNAEVWIEVEDNGPGMSPALLEHLFEPHLRPAENPNRGAGLGLSIVADVIRLHRGRIECHSTPGTGTRFLIRLPGV